VRQLSCFLATAAILLFISLPADLRAQDNAPGDAVTSSPDAASSEETTAGELPADETGNASTLAPASSTIDYAAWERVATRAEQALESGRASDQALETLRAELVGWREVFTRARADNQVRITTLQTQINTLGPPPGEGGTEPSVITDTREALHRQLEAAQAPVKAAEIALARANALIAETDTTLRARQTDAMFALGSPPLDPGNWPLAFDDVSLTLRLAWAGIANSFGTKTQRAELLSNAPVALVLGAFGMVLLLRGRRWVVEAGTRLRERTSGRAHEVWGLVLTLGQFLLPLAGVYALVEALHVAGFLGLRAQVLVDDLPVLGLSFFLARWLGNRIFGQPGVSWRVLNMPGSGSAEGRFHAAMLGLLYGISRMVDHIATYETYSPASRAVLDFPIVVFSGFLLLRLGQLLRTYAKAESASLEDGPSFATRTIALAGFALIVVGLVAPLAAAVGYGQLAGNLVFPTILTAGLVAALLVLHYFFIDLYGFVFKSEETRARDALVPVLASFVVALAAIPIFALIWGARRTDITELWTRVGEGVTIGETVIAPSDLVTFAVIFGIGFAATRLVQGMLKSTVLPKTRLDIGGQNAISAGIGYVGIFLAALIAITSAGINLSSLAIVAGALSVGIGFGLQNIVSNFVSGIILLIERPISEGDWIEVGGQMGYVRDISVRSTRIETFDRTDVILPNSDLISGVVTNYTRGNLVGRVIVPVGVAYGTDTLRVEHLLMDIAKAHPLITVNPPPSVFFTEFGADSLNFEIRAILRDVNFKMSVLSELNHEIARCFAEEGIEIPFAQRDIWLRNPEALLGGAAKSAEKRRTDESAEPPHETDVDAARAHIEPDDMHDTHGYGPEDRDDD
jgi:small-conductance mechanosensitive channel